MFRARIVLINHQIQKSENFNWSTDMSSVEVTDNRTTNDSKEFARHAEEAQPNVFVEFWFFLCYNKKWWLTPIIVVLLLAALLAIWSGSSITSFIYPMM